MRLFGPDLPPGFHHREGFVSHAEESALAAAIANIEFANFEMRGVVAKRRAAFFGRSYDAAPGPEQPIPDFLAPLRERFAAWADVDPMTGESRQAYEHSIPPVDSLRYSITFRTLR